MSNRDNYKWTTKLAPLEGVPMLDAQRGADLDKLFWPRDSYTAKLAELGQLVSENASYYLKNIIPHPTQNEQRIIEKLLATMHKKNIALIHPEQDINLDEIDKDLYILTDQLKKHFPEEIEARESGLEQYDRQYKVIEKPFLSNALHENDLFAYARVAGSNPVALRGVSSIPSKFPLTDAQYTSVMGADDNLSLAMSQKRIYMLDYHYLNNAVAEQGYSKPETAEHPTPVVGYSYSAIALFAVSKTTKKLTAVAIQCGQDPNNNNPMFLATDESDPDHYWGWERAKYVIQAADESEHQLSTHLGLTHLLCEAFALATIRNLPTDHAIYKLLISHFEGTNRINHNATVALLDPGKFVDMLFAAPLDQLTKKTIDIRLNYNFYDHFLPTELKNRGVDDVEALPDYPYRDDGLLIWNAIKEWVANYVNYTYVTSGQIILDTNLNAWMDDIINNAKIEGFKKISTKEDLIDVLTMIVFTSSAQHAAVNFTQPSWMMYAPYSCGTMLHHKPTAVVGNTRDEWLRTLPGLPRSAQKIAIYTLLGGLYNGHLGEYVTKDGIEIFNQSNSPQIYKHLVKFRDTLQDITKIIEKRNGNRPYPYTYLIPKNIPASINI